MAQVQFGGSWYQTIKQAAAAWAATALPDMGVIEPGEVARDAAQTLEAYWAGEAEKIGDIAPEGVDEAGWRAACVDALEDRILEARERAADARAAQAHQDQADADEGAIED